MEYKTNRTQIEGLVAELYKKRYDDFEKINKVFKKMNKDSQKLKKELIIEIEKPTYDDLKRKVIAVDGSNYQEQFESIAITIASAYVYMTNRQIESYLPSINIVPPYYSSLVNSIRMRTLEYQVAKSVLDSLNDKIDLIMLDGAITFPDEAIGEYLDNVSWVRKAYEDYNDTVNNFFDLVIDKSIPTVGIVKDSMSNKYFLSLNEVLNSSFNNSEINNGILNRNESLIKEWGSDGNLNFISEKSMIRRIFGNQEFCRTKYVEITSSLRNDIPVDKLKGNVLGFYYKTVNSERPFFIEIPMYFKKQIKEIMQIISSFSYYSLKRGYPFPLYAAHKKVELKKKNARNYSYMLKNLARKGLNEDYYDLFNDLFHKNM